MNKLTSTPIDNVLPTPAKVVAPNLCPNHIKTALVMRVEILPSLMAVQALLNPISIDDLNNIFQYIKKIEDIKKLVEEVNEHFIYNELTNRTISNKIFDITKSENLCMTGGVMLNCLMNSEIIKHTKCRKPKKL